MPILKFAHIAFIFVAFALVWANDLLFYQAARRGDVRGLATIARYGRKLIQIGIGLFIVGLVFGVLNGLVGRFNMFAPWLLLAYGMVVVMILLGIFVESPSFERLAVKAEEEADADGPSPELRAMMADRRPLLLLVISAALWIGVIYVMVAKPLT